MNANAAWLFRNLIEKHPNVTEITIKAYPFDKATLPGLLSMSRCAFICVCCCVDLLDALETNTNIVEFGHGPALFTLSPEVAKRIKVCLVCCCVFVH